jgi:hypothetical protein
MLQCAQLTYLGGRKSTCSISKSISRKIFHKFVGWSIRESCGMSAIEISLGTVGGQKKLGHAKFLTFVSSS